MKPILLEIVTKTMTTFEHCSHCAILFDETGLKRRNRQAAFDEYPQDLKEEFAMLLDWIRELSQLYRHRLLIRLIDSLSPVGMYKSFRHRLRKYPAFIVEGKETLSGWDRGKLEELLDRHIRASSKPKVEN